MGRYRLRARAGWYSVLIGESNVAIDPAIGGYGVADIYLGEFSPQHHDTCTHFKDSDGVHTCICQFESSVRVDTGLVAHRWLVRARAATKSSLASAPLKAVVAAVLNACSSLGIDPARGDTSISGLTWDLPS